MFFVFFKFIGVFFAGKKKKRKYMFMLNKRKSCLISSLQRCLSCHRLTRRHDLQTRFEEANPTWRVVDMPIAPDGDVMLDEDHVKGFKVRSH